MHKLGSLRHAFVMRRRHVASLGISRGIPSEIYRDVNFATGTLKREKEKERRLIYTQERSRLLSARGMDGGMLSAALSALWRR
jgi:hypothetical protein